MTSRLIRIVRGYIGRRAIKNALVELSNLGGPRDPNSSGSLASLSSDAKPYLEAIRDLMSKYEIHSIEFGPGTLYFRSSELSLFIWLLINLGDCDTRLKCYHIQGDYSDPRPSIYELVLD